jgi:hypothetical protein
VLSLCDDYFLPPTSSATRPGSVSALGCTKAFLTSTNCCSAMRARSTCSRMRTISASAARCSSSNASENIALFRAIFFLEKSGRVFVRDMSATQTFPEDDHVLLSPRLARALRSCSKSDSALIDASRLASGRCVVMKLAEFENARRAALTLLCIRLRRNSVLDSLPKDVVRVLSRTLWQMRWQPCCACSDEFGLCTQCGGANDCLCIGAWKCCSVCGTPWAGVAWQEPPQPRLRLVYECTLHELTDHLTDGTTAFVFCGTGEKPAHLLFWIPRRSSFRDKVLVSSTKKALFRSCVGIADASESTWNELIHSGSGLHLARDFRVFV